MKKPNKALNKKVKELCDSFSFFIEESEENYFRIFTGHIDGLTLFLSIEEHKVSFYFLVRTHDVVYHGDRSDIHIVLSLMLAAFLKIKAKISCSLFDIPHPAVDDEIWGRYIYPEQYKDSSSDNAAFIENLLLVLFEWRQSFWDLIGCPCRECLERENITNNRDHHHIESNLADYTASLSHYNMGSRTRPPYSFVYDIDNDVTIIKSKKLIAYLRVIISLFNYSPQKITGINGDILIDSYIYNFCGYKSLKKIEKIYKIVSSHKNDEINHFIVLENFIINVKEDYIIAKSVSSGINAFKEEKELIRQRHNLESSVLFPIPVFEWIINPCPAQFELLIKNLLERDVKVKRVRIAAPTNQGDKGRDLIIEWETIDKNHGFNGAVPPAQIIKVVGQCKAGNASVGKSKVQDIRDTIEHHDADGFFLAVSTQITYPLTETLEKLNQNFGLTGGTATI
ncbi:restriction endonuclease [Flavobacterium collinsii]|uniref:Mrr_cat domain-containing protein n=1 Tax=Flavobacterium collinsii TaxID=1114861 RepID=A0A9W4X4H8_9FLAO|nr:restriction endonuclease [Flavobacterium collinsii]CAI2768161.1 Mrr_cat domain-containing protein [Flavobacterium collinsii]